MKKYLTAAIGLICMVLLAGCGAEGLGIMNGEKKVGTDIKIEDINDFYYTKENINYGAYYQRYRFCLSLE